MEATSVTSQGFAAGLFVAAIYAFGWACEGTFLLAGVFSVWLLLSIVGVVASRAPRKSPKASDDKSAPSPLAKGDYALVLAGGLLLVFPWFVLVVFGEAGFVNVTKSKNQDVILAMLLIAAVVVSLILVSTMIDWSYVRPRLRGHRGSICATSMKGQWRSVTRFWLLHRTVVMLAGIAGATALVALAANAWVRPFDEVIAGAIAAAATVVTGYYLTRAAPSLAIAFNPPVQVGDVIEIAEEFQVHEPEKLREYFVVDIAREGMKLLQLEGRNRVRRVGPDALRTHDRTIDALEITKLLRGRRPIGPCASKCQLLTEFCDCKAGWLPPVKPTRKQKREQRKEKLAGFWGRLRSHVPQP
jgi:hypothetical protein